MIDENTKPSPYILRAFVGMLDFHHGCRHVSAAQALWQSCDQLEARDGSHHAATASVTLPDGRTVRICTVTDNACP